MSTERDIARKIAGRFDCGRIRRGYIAGKIAGDPAYGAVAQALRGSALPLWDAGCGFGLLAFYLREKGMAFPVIGTELDASKTRDGRRVAENDYAGVELLVGSVMEPPPGFFGNVAMLDVIHYLDPGAQSLFLGRLESQVPPGGVVLIRYTARDRSWRYGMTVAEEAVIRRIGWIRGGSRMHFPETRFLLEAFDPGVWTVDSRPLWGRTPFNSHLLTARRKQPRA